MQTLQNLPMCHVQMTTSGINIISNLIKLKTEFCNKMYSKYVLTGQLCHLNQKPDTWRHQLYMQLATRNHVLVCLGLALGE